MKRKNVYARDHLNHEKQLHALEEREEPAGLESILWILLSALLGVSLWAGVLWAVFYFVF